MGLCAPASTTPLSKPSSETTKRQTLEKHPHPLISTLAKTASLVTLDTRLLVLLNWLELQ